MSGRQGQIPILMYHSIADKASARFRPYAVPPGLFAEHMAHLHEQGYTPLTVSDFVRSCADGGARLPARPIVLTFDDGYADFHESALPTLLRYGFPATLYMVTGYIGGKSEWLVPQNESERAMLSWAQLREISASGIECGAHSHTHAQLDRLPHPDAQREIRYCRQILEDQLGHEIVSFAYPFGEFTAATRSAVQTAGYSSACAVENAPSAVTDDPFALSRLHVTPDMGADALEQLITRHSPPVWIAAHKSRLAAWRMIRRIAHASLPSLTREEAAS